MGSTPNQDLRNVSIDIGSFVNCFRRKDQRYCPSKILEQRRNVGGEYEYYVNYLDAHRRNDEWVMVEQLDLKTLLPNAETVDLDEQRQIRSAEYIRLRRKEIKIHYSSPIMSQFKNCRIFHVCEFCLIFKESGAQLKRHKKTCKLGNPPGHEIYRDGRLSVYQIDGAQSKEYCVNLCYLGSMFIDSGIQLGALERTMFYVLMLRDNLGYHLVSYFSEAKHILGSYNGSHFLTLPPYQRRGYATFLIGLAYEHAKMKNTSGVKADRALSYYQKYWNWVYVLKALKGCNGSSDEEAPSFEELSKLAAMPPEVVREILEQLAGVERDKCLYNVYGGILPRKDTGGIELSYLHRNQNNEIDLCPEFDADKIIWPHLQTRTRMLVFIMLLFFFLAATILKFQYKIS